LNFPTKNSDALNIISASDLYCCCCITGQIHEEEITYAVLTFHKRKAHKLVREYIPNLYLFTVRLFINLAVGQI